jgi:hypothetical protein
MKITELLTEGKKGVKNPIKPRNFVAKNAAATTSGAGAHKDKKKAEKQGDVKHKKKEYELAESDKEKTPSKKKTVTDRKTGKQYDPDEEFDKLKNSPEFQAQMKRMAKKESVEESYPKNQDLSGVPTSKLKAYLEKQSKQQTPGEGNQVKRVRAELQSREKSVAEEKQKGVDGKACWDGYKRMGTKKKGGKTVDNCVPTGKK